MRSDQPKLTSKHVREAAKRWDREPGRGGFRTGTLYEVRINGKSYPPKAIASYAFAAAGNKELAPSEFAGAYGGKWHKALEKAGFKPTLKSQRKTGSTPKKPATLERVEISAIDDEDTYPEGQLRAKLRTHLEMERVRDPAVIAKAKNNRKKRDGCLRCEVCNFDFAKIYGDKGDGYIEGHHTFPVHRMSPEGQPTTVNDIALVCANCHRMLHRIRPLPSINQLKEIVNRLRQN